jgi:Fe-S cluster assembly protein SufD
MTDKPKVVVSRKRRTDSATRDFTFTKADVPTIKDDSLASYRTQAWEAFKRLSLPKTTEEAWRRTDLRNLPVDSFVLPNGNLPKDLPSVPEDLLKPLIADQHGGQIVLTPSGADIDLDESISKQGVILTDLRTAQEKHPELVARILGDVVKPEEGKFAALAGALSQNGVLLYVPKNVQVEQPLHSILWGPGAFAHISHLLILVDEGASVTYVHESASPTEEGLNTLHAGIVEIKVEQAANLKFVELQSWGQHVWNFSHERARVERDANLDWIFGAIGSHLTKNFTELDLAGQGSTGRMSGFYFTDGKQHLDHDTQQNHFAPNTTSDLLFKGALKGKSHSVWQGMIYVAPGAQKADGYQANRNLVHGATVGKMEEEPLFYLKSRGIPQKEAERLIVEGFFDPIMQRIPFEGVRKRFHAAILQKMMAR